MINFKKRQSSVKYARDPASILNIDDENAYVRVRLTLSEPAVNARVSVYNRSDVKIQRSQVVSDVSDILPKAIIPLDTAQAIPSMPQLDSLRRDVIKPKKHLKNAPRKALVHGCDDIRMIAEMTAYELETQMRSAILTPRQADDFSHFCVLKIALSDALQPLTLTVIATSVSGESVGSVSTEVSLLDKISKIKAIVPNPTIAIRNVAGVSTASVNGDDRFVILMKREIGWAAPQKFETLAQFVGRADVSVPRSSTNACELIAIASDRSLTELSNGNRVIVPAHATISRASGRFCVIRNDTGFDINVTDLHDVDVVMIWRVTNGVKTQVAVITASGKDAVSIRDEPQPDTHQYSVTLLAGSNCVKLPCQKVVLSGVNTTQRPKISDVKTSSSRDGTLVTFNISADSLVGDASSSRKIINADPSAGFFNDELMAQREMYDQAHVFSVTRSDRVTGAETQLGVFSSGSFSDLIPYGESLTDLRYSVYLSVRDPESLLHYDKLVSGSAVQPYVYAPYVFKHPYAITDGLISRSASRQLRHSIEDAISGASLIVAVTDITVQPSDVSNVKLSIEQIRSDLMAITISDQMHSDRDGYVIIALTTAGDFELVGFVNSRNAATKIYHRVSTGSSVTYAAAILDLQLIVSGFVLGPTGYVS